LEGKLSKAFLYKEDYTMAGSKLIKELLIDVRQKGLTSIVNQMDKLEAGLENAAAGAELLDSSLRPIPDSLKKIIAEAKEVDDVMSTMGRGKDAGRLEQQFDSLDDTLNELVGSIAQLQDSITSNFAQASSSARADVSELIYSLEKLEDTTENVGRRSSLLSEIYDKLGASSNRVDKGLAGVNRQGRGQARNFAALAQIAGPIPIIYATIAANVFALSEAFRLLSDGAQLTRLEEIGTVMGANIGVPIQSIARDLQEATGYAVSYEDALRQASSAATFGFTAKQITDMTLAARRASVALGVDMNDALNRIIRGVSKLEIELLDELGITVRLTEAYSKYADAMGVSVNALTSYQKQQAYLNAVLAESEKRQSAVDPYLAANGWELLGANVKSAALSLTKFFASSLGPGAKELSAFMDLFKTSEIERDVTDYTKTLEQALKTGGSKGVANAYLAINSAQEAGLDSFGTNIESKVRLQSSKTWNAIVSGYSNMNPLVANVVDSAFKEMYQGSSAVTTQVEEAQAVWDNYGVVLDKVGASLGNLTPEQLAQGAAAIKNAKAQKSVGETMASITAQAKGTAQPFEQLRDGIDSVTVSMALLKDKTEGVDFFEQASLSPAGLKEANSLVQAMGDEFTAIALLEENKLRSQERGLVIGLSAVTIQQQSLSLERETLELSRQTLELAGASGAAILQNQTAININKLKELALERALTQERIEQKEAFMGLLQSQAAFNKGYSATLTNYQAETYANQDKLAILRLQEASLENSNRTSAERLRLELAINETLRAGADIKANEALRKGDMNIQDMQSKAQAPGGKGDIAGLEDASNQRAVLAKKLLDEKIISLDKYNELMRTSAEEASQANTARTQQEAQLNDLFLARTGQQSVLAMTAEQSMAYQQQVGASLYESSRAALDSFDPAMGAMFDGLQNFTVALQQVGKTSQGVWNAVGSGIQAAAGVMSMMSQKAVGEIDNQIAAEKKRDGKSETSKKKIAQLEVQKAKETQKAQRTAIIANTAVGIMSAISTSGNIYAGLAMAAVVAAMGITQLSALDSGSISEPTAGNIGKLELGSRQNNVDVGQAATGGELSYIRGAQGTGGANDFVPRARGSKMSPNVGYMTGEHGAEVVSSMGGSNSVTSTENTEYSNSSLNKMGGVSLVIQAIDTQSILDRAAEIFAAVESEANSKGFTLTRASR
jgi:hypothetical protein